MTATRNVKGLLGTKLGMTQVWDENNKLIPVTVVQADSNVITQLRNADTDGCRRSDRLRPDRSPQGHQAAGWSL